MLDIKKQIYKYLFISIFFLLFGLIYEMYSHGVYSNYMLYAFVIPLVFGFVIYLIIYKGKLNKYLNKTAMHIYNSSILTLTIGSIMQGFLEIYGTTNKLIFVYPILSIVLIIISIIVNLIYIKKDVIMEEIKKENINKKVGDDMKEKIILFALGVLVGGLIVTGAFFAYTKANSCNNNIQIDEKMNHRMPDFEPNHQDENRQKKSKNNNINENRTTDKQTNNN